MGLCESHFRLYLCFCDIFNRSGLETISYSSNEMLAFLSLEYAALLPTSSNLLP